MLDEPTDFIGNILAKLINRQLESPEILAKVKNWRMTIVLHTDYYPLSIIFNGKMNIQVGVINKPTLSVTMTFHTIIQLIKRETSLVRSLLNRTIKIKGLPRHPKATFRFYKLMNAVLKG
jgi:hypothetical protein